MLDPKIKITKSSPVWDCTVCMLSLVKCFRDLYYIVQELCTDV